MMLKQIKIIVITGTPGIGKTETAKRLLDYCPERTVSFDTDELAYIHPWKFDNDFYRLVGANLRAVIHNAYRWRASLILVNGVIIPGGIYDQLHKLLRNPAFTWSFYGLQTNQQTIEQRAQNDAKLRNVSLTLQSFHCNALVREVPGCHLIDTTHLSLEQVVDIIARSEGLGA